MNSDLRRRVSGAWAVLTDRSASHRNAHHFPVYTSPTAWRCDRCGNGMGFYGPGTQFSGSHRCPDGLTTRAREAVTLRYPLRRRASSLAASVGPAARVLWAGWHGTAPVPGRQSLSDEEQAQLSKEFDRLHRRYRA